MKKNLQLQKISFLFLVLVVLVTSFVLLYKTPVGGEVLNHASADIPNMCDSGNCGFTVGDDGNSGVSADSSTGDSDGSGDGSGGDRDGD